MRIWLAALVLSLFACFAAQGWCAEKAEKVITMDEVVVQGKEERGVFEVKKREPDTETTINKEGISLYGGGGQITPFKAIDILPSVNYQSADAYGLTNNQSIRIRGQTRVGSTIEGLSLMNYGLDPGVADRWLFDMENLSSISVYRGAVAAEKSLVPYNTGGTVDRTIRRPSDTLGYTFSESHGSFNFNKVFTRFDTGILPTGTKLFASYSHTNTDKWKGDGDTKADIFSFGIVHSFSPNVKVEVFGSYSNPDSYDYRSLTYAQASHLSAYSRYDYNSTLTGNSKQDINYYGYNKQTFTNNAYFANIEIKTSGQGLVKIKPFYTREKGITLAGVGSLLGSAGVRQWFIEHVNYGVGATYDTPLMGTDFTLGYWYSNQEPPGPPTAQKALRATNGSLNYAGWSMLANTTQNHEWHSPYLSVGKALGSFYLKGGLRYVYEKLPSIDLYNSKNVPNVSYDDALDYGTVNAAGSVHGGIMREWLPNFGVSYAVTKEVNTYFNYGRNFGRAGFDNWTVYGSNTSAFTKRGLTAQYLWDQVKPEISDNFDLGARFQNGTWYVTGTLFYGIYNNKGVSVADPALGGVKYSQNIGRAISYGAELEISKSVTKDLNIFATASYNKFQFTSDIASATASLTQAKGNQVPDVPVYEARLGATYRICGVAISPIIRYMGERYGDVENKERVPAYTTVDLDTRYTMENLFAWCKSATIGLGIYNIFNTQYISYINTSDDTKQGSASYYVGAPFTIMGRLELKL